LHAANGSLIKTYGTQLLTLSLGLRRKFNWPFIIADVQKPIIGADFLFAFKLLTNLHNKCLQDSQTNLKTKAQVVKMKQTEIKMIFGTSPFHRLLQEFPGILKPSLDPSCTKHDVTHHIITKGPPIRVAKARPLAPHKLKAAKAAFDCLLEQGLVRLSKSPWASPLVMAPKGTDDWRPCGDFKALNKVTTPDRYPVPHLQSFTMTLKGNTIFSKIDLVKAFHQIPVEPADVEKTAVITPFGLFEYISMPFGLRNASQTFQRFIDQVLRGLDFVFSRPLLTSMTS